MSEWETFDHVSSDRKFLGEFGSRAPSFRFRAIVALDEFWLSSAGGCDLACLKTIKLSISSIFGNNLQLL